MDYKKLIFFVIITARDYFRNCNMTKFVNGIRTAVENVPKPAWIHWPGQRSFCCCFTVRTGASAVGWFNFVSI